MNKNNFIKKGNIKIKTKDNKIYVMSFTDEKNCGIFSLYKVNKNYWYSIELILKKFGNCKPGLWIADIDKKTLFFGNFLEDNDNTYIKRKFYTGDLNKILVGVLFEESSIKSGFIIEKFHLNELFDEKKEILIEEKIPKKSKLQSLSLKLVSLMTDMNNMNDTFSMDMINNNVKKVKNLELSDYLFDNEENYDENNNYKFIKEKIIFSISFKYDNILIKNNIYTFPINNIELYPISLGIPEDLIIDDLSEKSVDYFKYDYSKKPIDSYKNQDDYYNNLKKSRFIAISRKFYGNDDLIYYESLANGCIPININDNFISPFIPVNFIDKIKKTEGFNLLWLDDIDYPTINRYADVFLKYTKKFLTTKAIIKYIEKFSFKKLKNVLFLSNANNGSDLLLQKSLLYGLKSLYENDIVDIPKVSSFYKKSVNKICDNPYDNKIIDNKCNRGRVEKRLSKNKFDIIIIMGIYTENDRKRLKLDKGDFPYKKIIVDNYKKNQVLFINGNIYKSKNNIEEIMEPYFQYGLCFCKELFFK